MKAGEVLDAIQSLLGPQKPRRAIVYGLTMWRAQMRMTAEGLRRDFDHVVLISEASNPSTALAGIDIDEYELIGGMTREELRLLRYPPSLIVFVDGDRHFFGCPCTITFSRDHGAVVDVNGDRYTLTLGAALVWTGRGLDWYPWASGVQRLAAANAAQPTRLLSGGTRLWPKKAP